MSAPARNALVPEAVVFDLDGVLVDSEQLWNESKQELVREWGGTWSQEAPREMMGMSSPEWSVYLRDDLGVARSPEEINRAVASKMQRIYRARLPLLPGAGDAVRSVGKRWPLGLASSSNREVIDLVLEVSGLLGAFSVTISSEEVQRGKPAPDVYLEAAGRLGVEPAGCVAIEDSSNGMRSAVAAGMAVIAVPNQHYPPDEDALALAAVSVPAVAEVDADLVQAVSERERRGR